MDANLLKVLEVRLRRIVLECYEIAFALCNMDMDEFGAAKLFDVFNQIFTTSFCLNTGYWPLYSSVTGQCLCSCGKFGVPCRHTKTEYHWIDMTPVQHLPGGPIFYPKVYGQIVPMNYDLKIKFPVGNGYSYDINFTVNVQYSRPEGRPGRRTPRGNIDLANGDVYSQVFVMQIFSRYHAVSEYYPGACTILFQPNPFCQRRYGSYFKELVCLKNQDPQLFNMQPRTLCLASSQVPPSSFILHEVNVPILVLPNRICAFEPNPMYRRRQYSRGTKNKGCQTPWKFFAVKDENDARRRDVASIWSSFPDSSEALSQNLRELATSSSQDFMADRSDDFSELRDSEEYDNQLPTGGYDRVIRRRQASPVYVVVENLRQEDSIPNRGVKRRLTNSASRGGPVTPSMVAEFTMSCEEADSTVSDNMALSRPSTSGVSHYKVSQKLKSAGQQDYAEFLNKHFPPLKPVAPKSDIDEEFELIETVIKEDEENDKGKANVKKEEGPGAGGME
ncbi:unnamed protein product [Acanthoscelides obtectus]|uniref:Uncharacterized protein n=1 Tax=Acanthoscelides obtectus TaxID=200917 RepID=A0A9P0MBY4_ACAOB|nr:unnamed protein product [Acanthoscelides obtectus]CAK1645897.1 hypothetical protein AOBTE_LOCUS14324 [Acanthoscelides obtectus]